MSKFTNAERARILAESERLLCDPPARPEPEPPREVHIQFEDDVAKWKREADEADAVRRAAKADLRRQVDDAANAGWAVIGARFDAIEQRLDELERTVSSLYEVAPAAAAFSEATVGRLQEIEATASSLQAMQDTLRAVQDRETKFLRERLAASEAAGARESAFLGRQLSEARRELDALHAKVDRDRDKGQTDKKLAEIEEAVSNVIEYQRRDPASR
jgi:hypothetical protein